MPFFKAIADLFRRPRHRIFISYSRRHAEVASGLYKLLFPNHATFLDSVSIRLGEAWEDRLDEEITKCTHLYVLWCEHAAASRHVAAEIRSAVSAGKVIVPIVIGSHPLSQELSRFQGVPSSFSRLCAEPATALESWPSSAIASPAQAAAGAIEARISSDWRSDNTRVMRNRTAAACLMLAAPLIGGTYYRSEQQFAAAIADAQRTDLVAHALLLAGDDTGALQGYEAALKRRFALAEARSERFVLASAPKLPLAYLGIGTRRDADLQREIATSHIRIGDIEFKQRQFEAARASFTLAKTRITTLAALEPRGRSHALRLAIIDERLGDVDAATGRPSAALEAYGRSIATLERTSTDDPAAPLQMGDVVVKLGDAHRALDNALAALATYQRAAALGSPIAMYRLGETYAEGRGVPLDYALARAWFEQGAAAGNVEAMRAIGRLYEAGLGVMQDQATAQQWYDRAAAAAKPPTPVATNR